MASTSDPPVSVIVPAYNEATVLPHCLSSVLAQNNAGRMHVVVAANGCTDGTASVARDFVAVAEERGHRVDVLDLESRHKCMAINAAERLLAPGHRVYLDADIVLSPNAIESTRLALRSPGLHLCTPRLHVAPPASRMTRSFAAIWSRLPVIEAGVVGVGCLAVSAEGRRRWELLPDIVADDYFIESHFAPNERTVLENAHFTVSLPERLFDLVRVRARWHRGRRELERADPGVRTTAHAHPGFLYVLRRQPALWRHAPAYVLINACARVRAALMHGRGAAYWERRALPRCLPPRA